MKAGVVYPQIELGGDTGAVKAFAQAAEELGYDHIVIYDHVLGAVHAGREPKLTGPYKETDPFHEPLITYAYLAGVTKKLELVTGVIILPQRQTALFAKQAADVDLFSDGRLRLGVGVGWNWVEYRRSRNVPTFSPPRQAAGASDRLDPQAVGRARGRISRTPTTGSTGPGYCRGRSGRSRSGWAGSARPRTTGRPGSGTAFCSQAALKPKRSRSRRKSNQLRDLGRDADAFGFESIQQYSRGDNQWPGDIAAWHKAGGSHISVVTMGANLTTVDGHIAAIKRWRDVYNSVS